MNILASIKRLTRFEKGLWIVSVIVVILSSITSKSPDVLSTVASLFGVTSLIFIARGDVIGHIIGVVFCLIYAFISYKFRYYGEMLTYACMTLPCSVIAVISWMRHPFNGDVAEVEVNLVKLPEVLIMFIISIIVTVLFYFILAFFGTANLFFSTISITTSFIASYLSFRRSPYYALGYCANDIVLIVLWASASMKNISYLPVLACFVMFLANDLYGFFNWRSMQIRQSTK